MTDQDDIDEVNEIKQKLVTMCLSLLEGEPDLDIIKRMSHSLDFPLMKKRMKQVYKFFVIQILKIRNPHKRNNIIQGNSISKINNKLSKDSFSGPILEGFDIFTLFSILQDSSSYARSHLLPKSFDEDERRAYEFFKLHTGRIEVVVQNLLQRTYFPILPICHFLSVNSQETFQIEVN